jgi:uncharacterized membrane protein
MTGMISQVDARQHFFMSAAGWAHQLLLKLGAHHVRVRRVRHQIVKRDHARANAGVSQGAFCHRDSSLTCESHSRDPEAP